MSKRFVTNNVPRPLIDAYELNEKERKEFDYLNWDKIENGEDSATFFRYKGDLYDLGEFSRIIKPDATRCHPMELSDPDFQGWHGYKSDTYFSGMVVKYVNSEEIVVGTYFAGGRDDGTSNNQ